MDTENRSPIPPTSAEHVDLRALMQILRGRLWVIVLSCAMAMAASTAYLCRAPKIYAAQVLLKVQEEDRKVINIEEVQKESLQTQESLKTVEHMLRSRALLGRVLEVNRLGSDPRFLGPTQSRPGNSRTGPEALITRLGEMINVRLRKGTRLIEITVEHREPALTELIANSMLQEFIKQNAEQRSQVSKTANQFLSQEAQELKRTLEASENALHAYRQNVFSVSLEDRQNIVVQQLKHLAEKSTEAKSARIAQETLYQRISQCSNDVQALLGIPLVANDQAVMEIRSNISKAEAEFANIIQEYKARHPKYIQAASHLAEINKGLQRAVLNVQENARSAYETARSTEQALEAAFREQEAIALELNRQAIQYNVLQRDVESNRALYQSVLNRIKETDLTKDLQTERIRVVQSAALPEWPIKPQKIRTLLLGLFAGLSGGILLAFLLNALDFSLNTVEQAEECLKLPVLSVIPRFSATGSADSQFIDSDSLDSAEAEAFRTLRTALSMLGRKEDRRSFLFTSALPSEGKTLCALHYGASLAQQGLRTLIIDGDLRCPMIERRLRPDPDTPTRRQADTQSPGVTDFLVGTAAFASLVRAAEQENLFFIPAGTNAPNPAELLAQNGLDALIEQALQKHDRVIVDSAPIHAVSDTLLMVGKIQSVCLVVRAHKTPKHIIERTIQLLKQADARIAGVVLNRLTRSRSYGYYYGSYYEYAYRGRYGKKAAAVAA